MNMPGGVSNRGITSNSMAHGPQEQKMDASNTNASLFANSNPFKMGELTGLGGRSNGDDRSSSTMSFGPSFGNGSGPWRDSKIWSSDFKPSTRDHSRTRGDTNSLLATSRENVEPRTGSSALFTSSESDGWNGSRQRLGWSGVDANTSAPRARSNGVSPVRRGSGQAPMAQPTLDNSQYSLFSSRPANAVGSRPVNGSFDGPATFGHRGSEGMIGSTTSFNRSSDESDRRPGSWVDSGSVYSPTDDRRSIASHSEYYGPSSAGASRSGSLPPSRHGNEPVQLPNTDHYSRLGSGPSVLRSHNPSISSQTNGRTYSDRHGSQQSDVGSMFGRLSLDNTEDQGPRNFRPTHGFNGTQANAFSQQNAFQQQQALGQSSQDYEDLASNGFGAFTPNGGSVPQYGDAMNSLRRANFGDNRGALTPNGGLFYSTGTTPPISLDPGFQRNEQQRSVSHPHPGILERKLRGLQQQEQQQSMLTPNFSQMLQSQYRPQYSPYPPFMPAGLPLNGVPGTFSLPPPIPGMMPPPHMAIIEPPRGPRDPEVSAVRSPLMEEFRNNSKGTKKYELKDIYGHLVEFSGDQHGSRFIQIKLETANSDDKALVFKEIQQDVVQLMQDVFGNYVIQKFFEHGDQNQKKLLANKMKGHMYALSIQMYGCRVVQKALEHILTDQQAILIKELEPHVHRLIRDQNGNHVIQKAIERVPEEHIKFIIDYVQGKAGELAIHSYGCRVIQRMLEHLSSPVTESIIQELNQAGPSLYMDWYGNYVTQHVVTDGPEKDRALIVDNVVADLKKLSTHKYASNVVEKCIVSGTDEQKRKIMQKILAPAERTNENILGDLIKDAYGNYVIQKLVDELHGEDQDIFQAALQAEMIKLKRLANVNGRQVQSIEKKMYQQRSGSVASNVTSPVSSSSPTSVGAPTSSALPLDSTSGQPAPVPRNQGGANSTTTFKPATGTIPNASTAGAHPIRSAQ